MVLKHNFYNILQAVLLEKEMETHSSILAWRIPGTEEPGGLPSVVLYRVGRDWSDLAAAAAVCCTVEKKKKYTAGTGAHGKVAELT